MDSKILLGKILQRFFDRKTTSVAGYNAFGYINETDNSVLVSREAGRDTRVTFKKILSGIEAFKINSALYQSGPSALQKLGITHVSSPIWSLLHLLNEDEYK